VTSDAIIENTAFVHGGGDPDCPSLLAAGKTQHCGSTSIVTPEISLLKITKLVEGTEHIVGDIFKHQIRVENFGTAATDSVATMTDVVPEALEVQAVAPTDTCKFEGQNVTCTIEEGFEAGDTREFTVTVKAVKNDSNAKNQANIKGGGDPVCVADGETALETDDETVKNTDRCNSAVVVSINPLPPLSSTARMIVQSVLAIALAGGLTAWMMNRNLKKLPMSKKTS